jgi:hypothetical protein
MTAVADDPAAEGITPVREPGKPVVVRTPSFDSMDTAVAWLTAHRPRIRDELHRSGAVLLRGLPVRDPAAFARPATR